jgi:hypothetical protein
VYRNVLGQVEPGISAASEHSGRPPSATRQLTLLGSPVGSPGGLQELYHFVTSGPTRFWGCEILSHSKHRAELRAKRRPATNGNSRLRLAANGSNASECIPNKVIPLIRLIPFDYFLEIWGVSAAEPITRLSALAAFEARRGWLLGVRLSSI